MHLDDERIQRFLDGELDPAAEVEVRAHAGRCPACRAALEGADAEQREVDALLSRLEDPAVAVNSRETVRAWDRRRGRRRVAAAASILVALGVAGGAWAATGGPLPGWLRPPGPSEPASTPGPGAEVGEPPTADEEPGAGMQARADGLVVVFPGGESGAEVRVGLTDEPHVTVRSLRGDVAFTDSREGRRLSVEASGAGAVVRVDVPRDALRVEIRMGGRRIFLQEAGRSRTDATRDATGVWRFTPGGGDG